MARSRTRKVFEQQFEPTSLRQLFDEKISNSRAVGRDGTRSTVFANSLNAEIQLIRDKVLKQSYSFTRYRDRLISKGPGKKPRLLSIPTVRDRLTLRALCEFLAEIYKDAAIKKPHTYVKQISDLANKASDDDVFVKIDIQDYYGSIRKDLLIRSLKRRIRIPEAIYLIRKAIHTPTLDLNEEEPGIPQGLSISNILASIYLMDVDAKMSEKWVYFRYVDDILIISKKNQVDDVVRDLSSLLKAKKLKHHPIRQSGKSYISAIDVGIEYLGFHIKRGRISIRPSSYKRMFSVLISAITSAKYKRGDARFLRKLNLKITGCRFNGKQFGWVSFFRQADNISQFARMDEFLKQQMKRRGLDLHLPETKTFLRSYFEIRYNLERTKYIPNFDEFNVEDKRKYLASIGVKNVDALSPEEVEKVFSKRVGREVGELEEDLFESIS